MSGLHRRQDVWITVENRVKISSSTSLRADRKADTSIPNAAALAMLLFGRVNMSNSSRLPISLSSTLSLHFDCTSDPFRNTQEFDDLRLVRIRKRIMAFVIAGDGVSPPDWWRTILSQPVPADGAFCFIPGTGTAATGTVGH